VRKDAPGSRLDSVEEQRRVVWLRMRVERRLERRSYLWGVDCERMDESPDDVHDQDGAVAMMDKDDGADRDHDQCHAFTRIELRLPST
jgi:hypothetical protein